MNSTFLAAPALAAGLAVAIGLGTAAPAQATPAPTPAATATPAPSALPTATPGPTATPRPTTTPRPPVPPAVATALSRTHGHASASRPVVMTGTGFGDLAGVQVAGVAVTGLQVLSPTRAAFVLPNAIDYQARVAAVSLTSRATRRTTPSGLVFTYEVTNRLDRQMAYAFRNWNRTANPRFGYLSGNDCANFASQTLLARGWKPSAQWYDRGPGRWSATWVSSTALSDWLKKRPDLAERLPYHERDRVVVGDIVQFRWPGKHPKSYRAWEHTAIVSKVAVAPDGHQDVFYVAHTSNRQYGGGTAAILRYQKGTRIQFFHLVR